MTSDHTIPIKAIAQSNTERERSNYLCVPVLQSHISDISGSNKFRNLELEARSAEIAEEFNRLLKEGVPRRSNSKEIIKVTQKGEVADLIGDFYQLE